MRPEVLTDEVSATQAALGVGERQRFALALSLGRRAASALVDGAQIVWSRSAVFYLALTAFNLFLARRTFGAGIWADNDSVCHYAYLRHLLEEFYPSTGTFIGWTPKYNLGTPFLLYNTPPGLYVAAAVLAKTVGLSALAALKAVVTAAFLSVPLLGARLAATFEERPRDLPKFAALTLSLFSSELFGLEFYFKNGMLNPAVAVPIAMACLIFFRLAQRDPAPRCLRWLACASVAFAATAFVHLLTAYMLALSLGCFALAGGLPKLGRSIVHVGIVAAVGAALVGFWLVPSLAFAAKEDAAYTWIRRAGDTLSNVVDGTIFSSYPVGFYPHFVTHSPVGILVSLCAAFGLVRLAQRRNPAVAACAATAALALLIALGPRPSFGLTILPMYDRLLWYRFVTLFELTALLVAAWGAWQLWELRHKLGRMVPALLLAGSVWAGVVMTQRAVAVQTAESYPQFVADVDAVSDWLRAHGDAKGRVFSEFLGQNVVESASVNYARHLIPIQSGFREAAGWVYENNEAAQELLRRGPFWFDPFPMIELAERYDVSYIVAGSPNLVRALSLDPRWKLTLETSHLHVFEAVGREPALAEAAGWDARVVHEGYTRGGGYEYAIRLEPRPDAQPARRLSVKTSWSPGWSARAGSRELQVRRTDDALLSVDLPEQAAPLDVSLTWDIGALRAKGNRVSVVGLLAALLLAGLGLAPRLSGLGIIDSALVGWCGVGAAVVGIVVLALRARPLENGSIGFGARGGLTTTFDSQRARVGAFDDSEATRLVHVLDDAWGERTLYRGTPARSLTRADSPAAAITLAPEGPQRITVRGAAVSSRGGARPDAEGLTLVLRDPATGETACRAALSLGESTTLPDTCARGGDGDDPGVRRTLSLETSADLVVTEIDVDSGIRVIEGESMHNATDDGGFEAFYAYGPPNQFPSNGVTMLARSSYERPIALDGAVELPARAYAMWLLTRTVSQRLQNGRGQLLVEVDGREVADVDLRTRKALPFWDDDAHPEWLPIGRIEGGATRKVRVTVHKPQSAFDGLGEVDALAFVPIAAR